MNTHLLRAKLSAATVLLFVGYSRLDGAAVAPAVSSPPPVTKDFSTAGFFALPDSGREVFNFNVGWRFLKGDAPGAEKPGFVDEAWEVVCLPHGLELLPSEASGCINYQGPAWYRKHFRLNPGLVGKHVLVHFEGVMGKSRVWLDGRLVAEHFGGYLPFVIDLTAAGATPGRDHVLAVRADNSDDPEYPPGKPQSALDFTYFGGIYRDVWLVATSPVHVTDPHLADRVAGGGVFVHCEQVGDDSATVVVDTELLSERDTSQAVRLETTLRDAAGKSLASLTSEFVLSSKTAQTVRQTFQVPRPHLWTPDDPYLHRLESRVVSASGEMLDGFAQRIGIRSIEFRGHDGLFLNGRPFRDKLMGANRHQDFAYVGNALPNSGQWRDAKKLRDAGMRIIRAAHYPQDPAFMDACDELGLFVIVATPGWQFWNPAPSFADRVVSDIRQMIRRDRNHPSVILWEPILNETRYPEEFARRVYDTVHAEYPFPGCYAACDSGSLGSSFFDVIYSAPLLQNPTNAVPARGPRRTYADIPQSVFTREWGDNVDDWNSHNSDSRVSRGWGEEPMLIQARHYARPPYRFTALDTFYLTPPQHVGGTLWHSFDHQRGYHPDPFWGGIMDAFRQPKYSWYMFQSQREPQLRHPTADSGPVLYIANELTPFSPSDITIFTNCEEVRLSVFGQEPVVKKVDRSVTGLPHPPVVFENAFDFMRSKALSRAGQGQQVKVVAEGLISGQVVVRAEKMQAKRAEKILLTLDNDGLPLVADGSDFVPVIAAIADTNGNIRRLSEGEVLFGVEGEGAVIGDDAIGANPRRVEWGSAPALVRSTLKSGVIRVTARLPRTGANTPKPATIEFTSVPPAQTLVYRDTPHPTTAGAGPNATASRASPVNEETRQQQLRQVERDQEHFEGKNP